MSEATYRAKFQCSVCQTHSIREAVRADTVASGGSRDVRFAMTIYRFGHRLFYSKRRGLTRRAGLAVLSALAKGFSVYVLHLEFPFACHLGRGLTLPHPRRIVVNARTTIGPNCTIFHGVTIGEDGSSDRSCPQIGTGVMIGASAILLGPVSVGDGAKIGAGAVITKDVPAGRSVVGHNRLLIN